MPFTVHQRDATAASIKGPAFSLCTPIRSMPVSTFRWITAWRPSKAAACSTWRSLAIEETVTSRSQARNWPTCGAWMPPITRIGTVTPARRSAMPSSTSATPSCPMPCACRWRATGTSPCP